MKAWFRTKVLKEVATWDQKEAEEFANMYDELEERRLSRMLSTAEREKRGEEERDGRNVRRFTVKE